MRFAFLTLLVAFTSAAAYSQGNCGNVTPGNEPSCAVPSSGVAAVTVPPGTSSVVGRVEIPVFIHVIREKVAGGFEGDITLAQMHQQIDALDAAFDGSTNDFDFRLIGYSRTTNETWFDTCLEVGLPDFNTIASELSIDPARVLNLYVNGSIDGRSRGTATIPELNGFEQSDPRNAVIINYLNFVGGSDQGASDGYVAVHEVGHYLGLYHTNHNTKDAPLLASQCKNDPDSIGLFSAEAGDKVLDTNPHRFGRTECTLADGGCRSSTGSTVLSIPENNVMNATNDVCTAHTFTAGQFARMGTQVNAFRDTLRDSPWTYVELHDGLSIPVDQNGNATYPRRYTFLDVEVRVAPGQRIEVAGVLDAEGTTFTERDAGQGWGGIRYEQGSTGLLQDATVEFVDDLSGSNPSPTVRVENADVTLEGVTLADGTGDGLFVVGPQADVTVRPSINPSRILRHSHRSVVGGNYADVTLDDVTIDQSGSVGVYTTTFADLYLRKTEIDRSPQHGARAHGQGRIIFGFEGQDGGATGQNNFITRSFSTTLYANAGGTIYGGGQGMPFDSNFRDNWFRRGASNSSERHAYADAADVIAECNYWNNGQINAPGPDFAFVTVLNGGTFDGTPFLQNPPDVSTACTAIVGDGVTEGGPSLSAGASASRSARTGAVHSGAVHSDEEAQGGPPEGMAPERWWAIAEGIEHPERSVGIGHVVSAIERARTPEETRRAFEVAAQLGSDGPHPGLEGVLAGQSQRPEHRPYALEALAAIHYGTGRSDEARADAETLLAEYGETEHARRGWLVRYGLAFDAGDRAGATAALDAVAARWPDYELDVLREATAGMRSSAGARSDAGARSPTSEATSGLEGGVVQENDAERAPVQAGSEAALPEVTELRAVYPNPTSGSVTVSLALARDAEVALSVVNALGRRVLVRAARREAAGPHTYSLDTAGLAPGVYVVRVSVVEAGEATQHEQTFTVVR